MLYPKSFFALIQGRLPDGEGTSVLLQFAFEGGEPLKYGHSRAGARARWRRRPVHHRFSV